MLLWKLSSDLMLTLVISSQNLSWLDIIYILGVYYDHDFPTSFWSPILLDWLTGQLSCHVPCYFTFIPLQSFRRQGSSNLYLSSRQTDWFGQWCQLRISTFDLLIGSSKTHLDNSLCSPSANHEPHMVVVMLSHLPRIGYLEFLHLWPCILETLLLLTLMYTYSL